MRLVRLSGRFALFLSLPPNACQALMTHTWALYRGANDLLASRAVLDVLLIAVQQHAPVLQYGPRVPGTGPARPSCVQPSTAFCHSPEHHTAHMSILACNQRALSWDFLRHAMDILHLGTRSAGQEAALLTTFRQMIEQSR